MTIEDLRITTTYTSNDLQRLATQNSGILPPDVAKDVVPAILLGNPFSRVNQDLLTLALVGTGSSRNEQDIVQRLQTIIPAVAETGKKRWNVILAVADISESAPSGNLAETYPQLTAMSDRDTTRLLNPQNEVDTAYPRIQLRMQSMEENLERLAARRPNLKLPELSQSMVLIGVLEDLAHRQITPIHLAQNPHLRETIAEALELAANINESVIDRLGVSTEEAGRIQTLVTKLGVQRQIAYSIKPISLDDPLLGEVGLVKALQRLAASTDEIGLSPAHKKYIKDYILTNIEVLRTAFPDRIADINAFLGKQVGHKLDYWKVPPGFPYWDIDRANNPE
ncbi:MAG: hypothetical protein Q7S61_02045 [bacterium]|nr:hypothetical protein [bacterium]